MPQELPAATGDDDPIRRFDTAREAFAARLRDLHIECGKPKQSVLVQAAERSAAEKHNDRFRLHPGTLSQVLSGKKTPTHDFLSALIRQLVQARPAVGEYKQVWPTWDKRWQDLMRMRGEADRARQRHDAAQQKADAELRTAAAADAARIITEARQEAKSLTDAAAIEAEGLIARAREEADTTRTQAAQARTAVAAEAREDAKRILSDARREAESILGAASSEAATLVARAREEAESVRADAARHAAHPREGMKLLPADAGVEARRAPVGGKRAADRAPDPERAGSGSQTQGDRVGWQPSGARPTDEPALECHPNAPRELAPVGSAVSDRPGTAHVVTGQARRPYAVTGLPDRLETVVFRWTSMAAGGTGIQPVAHSVNDVRAQDLRDHLAPLLWPGEATLATPSVVRYILTSGEAAVIHRVPSRDAAGRPSTTSYAVIGHASVLSASRAVLLDYPDAAWLENVSGPIRAWNQDRVMHDVRLAQARYIEQIPAIRLQLEAVTAQLLRTPARRLSIRRPAHIRTRNPSDIDFGHLLIWGLCKMLEGVVKDNFFTYATCDTQDSFGLRLVCMPEWQEQRRPEDSPARIPLNRILRDEAHLAARALVGPFIKAPDRQSPILRRFGLPLDLARSSPQQRLEAIRGALLEAGP
ncbi:hypothetical protein [Streptomyces aureus]|uniref:hypothetical protein n=1 Tax=Streptomyces aureus TaxID=193461 RepID=UPI0033D5F112